MIGASLLTLAASLLVLIISGRYTIRFLTNVTTAFGISEFTVAFIILALATSMPELFIGISSSLQNAGSLVLSTVFGSNIINVTLIIGITAIASAGISTRQLHLKRDIITGGVITILPLIMLLNGTISRGEGIVLLAAFCMYLFLLVRDQTQYGLRQPHQHVVRGTLSIFFALLAIGVLIFSADRAVESVMTLAQNLNVPAFIMGLLVLALGTSLPELVTVLQSSRAKKPAMVLGNIIGSNIANSSLIVGVASIIRPIEVTLHPTLVVTMIFMATSIFLMGYLASSKNSLSILDGLVLIGCFLLFGFTMLLSSVPEITAGIQ